MNLIPPHPVATPGRGSSGMSAILHPGSEAFELNADSTCLAYSCRPSGIAGVNVLGPQAGAKSAYSKFEKPHMG